MSSETPRIAVIGGSGLYAMQGLEDVRELRPATPFGAPSDAILVGALAGVRVAFLARHGRGHHISPSEVNHRANLFALKQVGVERVIAVSACGSLREHLPPGAIVVPDQLFDFTRDRPRTFFGGGLVAHISVAEPFCGDLGAELAGAVAAAGGDVRRGGRFITIEGPRFSTKAESEAFRGWGMDIIGMTTSPEAFLAREAELCYAVMAHVTDYDVWHASEEPVTVEVVIRRLRANTALAERALAALIPRLAGLPRTCPCGHALADALITDRARIPPERLAALAPLVGKYLR
jgi:5'-methylthioadenosine phosphorylase